MSTAKQSPSANPQFGDGLLHLRHVPACEASAKEGGATEQSSRLKPTLVVGMSDGKGLVEVDTSGRM